jgi:RsiW-degrading membrane proteinase PrsW (M82 family)
MAWLPAATYALYLVCSLWVLGFVLEGRRIGIGLELLRTAGTAAWVGISGRWFGIAQLDARIVIALVVVFGIGAVALWLLAGYEHRSPRTGLTQG